MKDRKPPYVLGGVIIIALGACVYIGIGQTKNAIDPEKAEQDQQQQQQQQQQGPQEKLGHSRPTASADTVAKTFGHENTATGPQPKKPMSGLAMTPSILIPPSQNMKPKMNTSETYSLGPAR
jgi:Sec-independent protein translocase protein TatA